MNPYRPYVKYICQGHVLCPNQITQVDYDSYLITITILRSSSQRIHSYKLLKDFTRTVRKIKIITTYNWNSNKISDQSPYQHCENQRYVELCSIPEPYESSQFRGTLNYQSLV